jgi:hypothetical protein
VVARRELALLGRGWAGGQGRLARKLATEINGGGGGGGGGGEGVTTGWLMTGVTLT